MTLPAWNGWGVHRFDRPRRRRMVSTVFVSGPGLDRRAHSSCIEWVVSATADFNYVTGESSQGLPRAITKGIYHSAACAPAGIPVHQCLNISTKAAFGERKGMAVHYVLLPANTPTPSTCLHAGGNTGYRTTTSPDLFTSMKPATLLRRPASPLSSPDPRTLTYHRSIDIAGAYSHHQI